MRLTYKWMLYLTRLWHTSEKLDESQKQLARNNGALNDWESLVRLTVC
jgi:hypothetical protein